MAAVEDARRLIGGIVRTGDVTPADSELEREKKSCYACNCGANGWGARAPFAQRENRDLIVA